MTWHYHRPTHRLYAVSVIGMVVYGKTLPELRNKVRGSYERRTGK